MKVGRRLATKVLNAGRFVLGLELGRGDTSPAVTETLDRSMLATLADVVRSATEAFEAYDYTSALEATERFFWGFCDDYLELVKDRAYGDRHVAGAESARAALALALSVQLRLFAPTLPFVTEELWSRWQEGSVHRAPWPTADELQTDGDPAVLQAAGAALSGIRSVKSDRKLSMRAELDRVVVRAGQAALGLIDMTRDDLAAAGRVHELVLVPDPTAAEVTVQA
jgi:valyl-tRNA synthetase